MKDSNLRPLGYEPSALTSWANDPVADSEGFEPSVPLPVRLLSREVVSANSPNCPFLILSS